MALYIWQQRTVPTGIPNPAGANEVHDIRRLDAGARATTYIFRKPIFCWVGCVKKNPDFFFFPLKEELLLWLFYLGLSSPPTPCVLQVGITSNPLTGEITASLNCGLLWDNWAACWLPSGSGVQGNRHRVCNQTN